MTIEIRGHLAASALLTAEPKHWDCIFIIDSDQLASPELENLSRHQLVLYFDDIENSTSGKVSPSSEHVQRALEFSQSSDQLLVSCRAGQSRSAALALLIFANRFGVDAAVDFLDRSRHRPNRELVRLGADLIDEPFLPTALDRWLNTINTFLDSANIETEIEALKDAGIVNLISCPKA